jgi:Uncharacterized protein conserved in archaea
MIRLPDRLRESLSESQGRVYTETDQLLAAVETTGDSHTASTSAAGSDASAGGEPVLVTVGDIVTYHVLEAGVTPDVAVTDGRTEREDVAPTVAARLQEADGTRIQVECPPAELSRELLVALRDGIRADSSTILEVDGEEDLAAVPAQLVSPPGSSIVYGQPGEGMVHVSVDEATAEWARDLLSEFDGDTEAALAVLDS